VNTQDFQCPNLDDVPDSDLVEWNRVLRLLAEYTRLGLSARDARGEGYIGVAQRYEARADALYQQLPAWARW
jgi:hypothetical protein